MQIVEQTKRRSGWRVYRTLAALGVPRSVYYAWKSREDLQDRTAKPCRVYEVLPEERGAICEFALQYPKIGYRKLTWMMVDAGTACVGESTVYRVLSDADLLSRWKRSTVSSGEYNFRPNGPNQQWHTDVMYVWVAARFYFLVSFVDAYSRYIVHHKLLMSLDGKSVATELQAALEAAKDAQTPRRTRSRQRVRQSRRRGGHQDAQPDRYQDETAAPGIQWHRRALQWHRARRNRQQLRK